MYAICVRDHFMIAHSFRGETFGPAPVCTAQPMLLTWECLRRPELDPDGVVVDIGKLSDALRAALPMSLNYRNLDEPSRNLLGTTPPPRRWRG